MEKTSKWWKTSVVAFAGAAVSWTAVAKDNEPIYSAPAEAGRQDDQRPISLPVKGLIESLSPEEKLRSMELAMAGLCLDQGMIVTLHPDGTILCSAQPGGGK